MPYIPPVQRTSPRDRRAATLAQGDQTDLLQQQSDAQQQQATMAQLAQLYGLSQQSAEAPLHMQDLQAGLATKQFDLQHAPEVLQAKLAQEAASTKASTAQDNYYTQHATGAITPHDMMEYRMHTGEDYVTPEQKAANEQKQSQARWAAIAASAKDFGVNPQDEGNIVQQFGPENLQYLKGLHASSTPQNYNVPSEYMNDPQIAQMLQTANAKKTTEDNYYKPGGELQTNFQRHELYNKIHPNLGFLKDLWEMYQ